MHNAPNTPKADTPPNSTQRVKAHRQRKRDGKKQFKLTINPTILQRATKTGSYNGKSPEEILNIIITSTFARVDMIIHAGERLAELGETRATYDRYCQNELRKMMPLTAEQFLNGEV